MVAGLSIQSIACCIMRPGDVQGQCEQELYDMLGRDSTSGKEKVADTMML